MRYLEALEVETRALLLLHQSFDRLLSLYQTFS
jgi:hypothetical protein